MVECTDCHRTGFTDDELAAHQAAPVITERGKESGCFPLSVAELKLHLKHDFESVVEAATHLQELGQAFPTEETAIAELRAELEQLKAQIASRAAATQK